MDRTSPRSKSTVVNTQREHGLTRSNSTAPMRIRFQPSSACGAVLATTRFGRKRSIGTGAASFAFNASSAPAEISSSGNASAKLTSSPALRVIGIDRPRARVVHVREARGHAEERADPGIGFGAGRQRRDGVRPHGDVDAIAAGRRLRRRKRRHAGRRQRRSASPSGTTRSSVRRGCCRPVRKPAVGIGHDPAPIVAQSARLDVGRIERKRRARLDRKDVQRGENRRHVSSMPRAECKNRMLVLRASAEGADVPSRPAIQRHEWFAVAVAFVYFFCVLAAYYVMRPVRDQLSASVGSTSLPIFYAATFVATLVLTPLFGALVARFPRRRVRADRLPLLHRRHDRVHSGIPDAGRRSARACSARSSSSGSACSISSSSRCSGASWPTSSTPSRRTGCFPIITLGGAIGALAGPSADQGVRVPGRRIGPADRLLAAARRRDRLHRRAVALVAAPSGRRRDARATSASSAADFSPARSRR